MDICYLLLILLHLLNLIYVRRRQIYRQTEQDLDGVFP